MAQLATCCISFNFLPIILVLLQLQTPQSHARIPEVHKVKTEVFLSPKISLQPGQAADKYYYNIDFPRGHIALKSFNAEVVDERGNPVPLHETYLHHWLVQRYYQRTDVENNHANIGLHNPNDRIIVGNSGICHPDHTQYYGIGSETRKTSTHVPDPYGIEVGKPEDIPTGYEEAWLLNVHAIDTRGVEDKLGCTECRCDLYNVDGEDLPENYTGGLLCCHDETRCKLKKGENYAERSLYLRYTIRYLDWKQSIVPVKIYIIDVTDVYTRGDESRGIKSSHNCLVEYNVDSCHVGDDVCIHMKTLTVDFLDGGDLIYGVGHQHTGGVGTALYGEGGRLMCSSIPTYGQGSEAGDEAGYIVGMSTCYPSPSSVKISAGETLTLVSNYSSEKSHTGVMGLFYILVAEDPKKREALHVPVDVFEVATMFGYAWPLALLGGALVAVVGFAMKGRSGKGREY